MTKTEPFGEWLELLLDTHSVVVFRGLPVNSPIDFSKFITSIPGWKFDYLQMGGGGPRVQIDGPVFTSTESPPEFVIPLHHELAYLNSWPKTLAFYSELPAK